jgi:ADP-heptose:LPS heptosyltransferase
LAKPKGGLLTSVRDYLFFRSCGIRRVIGVPFTAWTLRCGPIAGSDLYTSETARQLEALRGLGEIDLDDPSAWDLALAGEETAEAERLLAQHQIKHPFLAASVGTKMQAKDWELGNWQKLMRRMGERHPHLPLVMLGVGEEAAYSERILSEWRGPKANLCGQASPRVSAALLRRAALMVCHDSGPMHLAATVGTPCVAIFSARNPPGEWYPRGGNHTILYHRTPCWGCGLTVCIDQQKACILSITVDEVADAVERRLTLAGLSAISPLP